MTITVPKNNSPFESPADDILVDASKNNEVSIDSIHFVRNILDSDFENYTGDLPLIITPIKIKTTKFVTTYKGFLPKIIEQIEYYIWLMRCNRIRNILQPKYLECVFLTQDLGNAIQKIKQKNRIYISDAASLLTKLLKFQSNDHAWFVKLLIDDMSNQLVGIFWMSPKQCKR
ncbi:20466_t:CDS:2 [Racocetra persica]|uniref:20466_t:CDS:1 n=1 Tax=Racocetra persica TaxID=160502 RepID=A0ACA9N504_9GLOM|nr:20466_t:CDS:2 [Racocetra persica]